MMAAEFFREVRFKTMTELVEAIAGKEVWRTPEGYADIIGGMTVFNVRDSRGRITDEFCVYVRDIE
jgi:hypothetical protein